LSLGWIATLKVYPFGPDFTSSTVNGARATFSGTQRVYKSVMLSRPAAIQEGAGHDVSRDAGGDAGPGDAGPGDAGLGDADALSTLAVDFDFQEYVRTHSAGLVRAAYLLTGDRQVAEDLAQSALAKVSLRWDVVSGRGDPDAYVRKAMVRTAIGWRRRRWHGECPTALMPETAGADPTVAVDARQRLRAALLSLPPRQRAAVVLRFYEDLSEADTALTLGCSVGAVKSQTAKGLAKLRQFFAARPLS
jgi:RNA polymerase sigma-70 factor (sigma-E family)